MHNKIPSNLLPKAYLVDMRLVSIYSVLFGTGLIVGSLVGGPVIEFFGQLGRNLLGQAGWSIGTLGGMTFFVVVLVIIACLGTLRLPELLLETDESQ